MMQHPSSRCALLGFSALFMVSACGDSDGGSAKQTNSVAGQGGAAATGGGSASAAGTAAVAGIATIDNPCGAADPSLSALDPSSLFDAPRIPAFDLYLPADAWASLKANARDEIYVPAQACLDGTAIGLVGLRFKGSYGSLYNCFDAAGKNTCRKLGMKIKFDEYEPKQRFYGLDKLNFHSYHYDDSYLREPLSYNLYRAMGIVAPRVSWAVLRVNGNSQGLFGMVEEVDKRLVKDRWPDNDQGNLFKEVWPGQTDEDWTTSHLHTNTQTPVITAFMAFSSALNAATSDNLRATLGRFVDLDYFTRYMVVDDAIANFDGVTTFYTNGNPDEVGNHNYYFYEQSPNQFSIIPWDLEATLSLATSFGTPYWQTLPADCSQQYLAWGGPLHVVAPGCNRVFQALAADPSGYRVAAQQLLDGPFAAETMLANVDRFANFVRAEATVDPQGPGAANFETAVGFVKQELPKLRKRLEHFMSGVPSVPLVLATTAVNDFETADAYGITDGTSQMSDSTTKMSVELDMASPLNGTKSLRILYDFGDPARAASTQWLFYSIPLDVRPKDLSKYIGIRLKMRANLPCAVRLTLTSPNNSQSDKGVEAGWDLPVTADSLTTSVLLADAKPPTWSADPGDSLAAILRSVTGLRFMGGRDLTGQIATGVAEQGWVDIDDIEFY
jgi:spore coat protein H